MIYVFGDLNVDLTWKLPAEPTFGGPQLTGPLDIEVGGVAFNCAKAIADTGEESLLLGRVGQDPMGDFLVDALAARGFNSQVVRDSKRRTGIATLLYAPDGGGVARALLISASSANHWFPVEELPPLTLGSDDILFLTGYSIFREGTHAACRCLAETARDGGARVVVDLLPHDLTSVGEPEALASALRDLGAPFDLCIGEDQTWEYLLGLEGTRPTLDGLADRARPFGRYCCIRHGAERCEREALSHGGEPLYDTDTGYLRQPVEGRRAYGDLLTARLLNQLFLGKQPYLHDPAHEFSIPLDALDLVPDGLAPEARILDVGCGYGRTFEPLLARGLRRITGLESSRSLADVARRRYPQVEIVQASFEHWAAPAAAFDVVLLIGVLTCLHDDTLLRSFLERAAGALRPGGLAIIADFAITDRPEYHAKYERYQRLFPGKPFGVFMGDHGTVNRHFDPAFLREAVAARFAIDRWEETTFATSFGGQARGVLLRANAL